MVYGYGDYKRQQQQMDDQIVPSGKGVYYWVTTVKNGKTVICGYKMSYMEANTFGIDTLGGNPFKVIPLKTRDINSAARLLKGKMLNDYKDIDKATEKMVRDQYTKKKKNKKNGDGGVSDWGTGGMFK